MYYLPTATGSPLTNVKKKYLRALTKGIPRRSQTPKFSPVPAEEINGGALYDFGKEIFGFLYIEGVAPENQLHVSYGESREEALDTWFTVVREDVSAHGITN